MIHLRGLRYRYPGGEEALRGVDLELPDGSFAALCGPSGGGKSTLLLVLAGLLEASEGELLLDGHDLRRRPDLLRRAMGLVFQDPEQQIVGATVAEDLAFGPQNLGLGRSEVCARVEETLHTLALEDLATRPCASLSGGQRRLVALGGVLALRPATLLLDEPFGRLDFRSAQVLLRHLLELRARGRRVVIVTHDLDRVAPDLDLLAVLRRGAVVASGPPQTLFPALAGWGVRPPCAALWGQPPRSWLEPEAGPP